MLLIYRILLYLIFPFIWLRLYWRGRKLPEYRKHWAERLGFVLGPLEAQQCIWIHAASLGETIAITPFVRALKSTYPTLPIVITNMTPTGRKQASQANPDKFVYYVPYDYPSVVRRFIRRLKPRLCILVETELWPNLINICHAEHVPILVANARLSEKSRQGYGRIRRLMTPILQKINLIAAQTEETKSRFINLGVKASSILVTGSLKFDADIPQSVIERGHALRVQLGSLRPVWIAASTHDDEELQILKIYQSLKPSFPNLLLILVPRHPDRFEAIAQLCQTFPFKMARRSSGQGSSEIDIYLGDTMGELLVLYAASDVAFVGGSLIPRGGHNPLEPAALGVPVLMGPHTFNFAEIVCMLKSAGHLIQVDTANELFDKLNALLHDPAQCRNMGEQGKQVVDQNRGALHRQLQAVASLLNV